MKKIAYTFLLILGFACNSTKQSQEETIVDAPTLKRKAMLGVSMATLTAEVVKELGIPEMEGVYVQRVFPNTTADALGIPEGSVITAVNDKETASGAAVVDALGNFKVGDALSVTYWHEGKESTKRGEGVARPLENHPNAEVFYGQVDYEGNSLRSILCLPKGVENPPVVFFLQGYTCSTIDYPMQADNPVRQLVAGWLRAGYAVYRVEKPGIGDSESDVDCLEIDFQEELTAFKNAYRALQQESHIDSSRIFLFGHSMGGVIAPLLSEVSPPKGTMVYGITAKPWYEYMVDIYTVQPKIFGADDSTLRRNEEIAVPLMHEMLVEQKSAEEILDNPEYKDFLEGEGISLEGGQYIGRHLRFWQSLSQVDLPEAWKNTETKVLAIHGEYDIQAISDEGVRSIVALAGENRASFKLVEKTDHAFAKFSSMQESLESRSNGSYGRMIRSNFNPDLIGLTVAWMKEVQ